jgi:hypothetical protein
MLEEVAKTLDLLRGHAWPDVMQRFNIPALVCLLVVIEHIENRLFFVDGRGFRNPWGGRGMGRFCGSRQIFDLFASLSGMSSIREVLYIAIKA